MMKVCHVTSAHSRYDVRIFEKECVSLAKYGYDVTLIVNDDEKDEIKDGVKIVSTGFKPSGRRQRMLSSMKYIWSKMQEVDADIYHFHDPELLQQVSKLKKKNKKVIFDAHEDTELQIMDKEWIPFFLRKMVSIVYKSYTKPVFQKCSGIITVTPAIVRKLEKYNERVEMITNYPIIKSIVNDAGNKEESLHYIFFAGGVSKQWCHDMIIQAISGLDGIRYKMAGHVEEGYLEYLKTLKGWEKVDYLGKIPHEDVQKFYCSAIAGMAINNCSQAKGEGTLGNTKLFEVMAAQIPVICTDYRLWKDIVEGNRCGICVDCESVDEVREAIRQLLDAPCMAQELGRNGRKAVETKYNWSVEEQKLISLYKDLLDIERDSYAD